MRDDRQRILDILEAIEKMEKHTSGGKAASKISDAGKEKYSAVPWRKIIGMRNTLVHGYFGVDADVVWAAVENDLPTLKREMKG